MVIANNHQALARKFQLNRVKSYQLTFAVSGNWLAFDTANRMIVATGDQKTEIILAQPTEWTPLNSSWCYETIQFQADSTETVIRFRSIPGDSIHAPYLSDVQLKEVHAKIPSIGESDPAFQYDGITGELHRSEPIQINTIEHDAMVHTIFYRSKT